MTSIQLVNYTSASRSLNNHDNHRISWLLPNLSHLVLYLLVDSACTTLLGRLFHTLTTLLVKKNLRKLHIVRLLCNLNSLSLVLFLISLL